MTFARPQSPSGVRNEYLDEEDDDDEDVHMALELRHLVLALALVHLNLGVYSSEHDHTDHPRGFPQSAPPQKQIRRVQALSFLVLVNHRSIELEKTA